MKKKSNNQAFLILSDCVSESLIRLYLQVKASTAVWGDTFIVYHNRSNEPEKRLQDYEVYEFTNAVMSELGYTPIRETLIPGSNHFPIIKFHLDYPDYDYYWCIEDDIIFSGVWSSFFNTVIKKVEYDFISSYIKQYSDKINLDSYWWDGPTKQGVVIDQKSLAMSFNPIYSLSNRAAKFLDKSLKAGWKGHHEMLMATLLISNKFKVRDFGGGGKFVPPGFKEKFYNGNTHVWRPAFEAPENLLNKIYHPVKNRFKITADFKFKISVCIEVDNMLQQLKQTLAKNIQDNYTYQNFQFIILNCDSDSETKSWLRETMSDYIKEGKLIYYETELDKRYTPSVAKNIAFKLADGDILCNIKADQFIGKNFVDHINNQFKIDTNIVINAINYISSSASLDKRKAICVKKSDFLYVKGFNEQLSAGAEDVDFINRLELSRIKQIQINKENYIPFSVANGFSIENAYITLDQTLVQYIDPATSNIIYIHHTGSFQMGTITDNSKKGHTDFRYNYLEHNTEFEYILKEKNWATGTWYLADDDRKMILTTNEGFEFQLDAKKDFYETKLNGDRAEFYNLTALESKKRLVDFYYFHKNRQRLKSITSSKVKELNRAGFGSAIVYKNFNYDHPVITGHYGKVNGNWLSISVFVSENKRHLIIKNVIKPLIEQLIAESELISYKLAFNYQSGENLRLSLLVSNNKKDQVAKFVDQQLKDFFKAKKLLPGINKKPARTIFMPFHINSVQYGLYPTIINSDYEYIDSLEQAFSTCLVEAFADEVIDDELILTFVMYVIFDCYKIIQSSAPDFAEKWLSYNLYTAESLKTTYDHNKLIQDQYEALADAINEIYADTINGTALDDLAWLKTWEGVFIDTWAKVLSEDNTAVFFGLLQQIIDRQLDADINFRKMITVFIDRTIVNDREMTINNTPTLIFN